MNKMTKVKKVIESRETAHEVYKFMEDSKDFVKLNKRVGPKNYTILCGFSVKDTFTMKVKGWSEAVEISKEQLPIDQDFCIMFPVNIENQSYTEKTQQVDQLVSI